MSLQNTFDFKNAEQFNEFFKNYFKEAKDFSEEFDRLPKPIDRREAEEIAKEIDYNYGYARNPDYDVKESPLVDVLLRGQKAIDEQKEKQKELKEREEEKTDKYEMVLEGSNNPNDDDDDDDKQEQKTDK